MRTKRCEQVLFPLAAFVARFTAAKAGQHELGLGRRWFQMHLLLTVLGVICAVAGFVLAVKVSGVESFSLYLHHLLGVAVLSVFVFLMPTVGGLVKYIEKQGWQVRLRTNDVCAYGCLC